MAVYKNENRTGYVNGTSFVVKSTQQGIDTIKQFLDTRYDEQNN
jgi:hypothetical protein